MGKQADGVNYDHEEGMAFRSSLASDVRSMLADYSRTRKDEAEKARDERRAFLRALRNQVMDLNAETRKITSGSKKPPIAIDTLSPEAASPEAGMPKADPAPGKPVADIAAAVPESTVPEPEPRTEPPAVEMTFEAVVIAETEVVAPAKQATPVEHEAPAKPSAMAPEVPVVQVAPAEPAAPAKHKIVESVPKPESIVVQTKVEKAGESDWLRETILGPKPRKSPGKQKRAKK